MHPTKILLFRNTALRAQRTPLIKFLGKRSFPKAPPPSSAEESPITSPHPHPASPSHSLPDSFMAYRSKAQQHGPLGGHNRASSPSGAGNIGGQGGLGSTSGHQLGDVAPAKGEVWDRSELPSRFSRLAWSPEEMEAVELGGAGLKLGWGGA